MTEFIFNAEPFGFSPRAEESWKKVGTYISGSWANLDSADTRQTTMLITRLGRYVDQKTLEKFPKLKVIVTATTGLDHIDLAEAKVRNIKVLSLRGEDDFLKTIPSTAEHTWALIMSLVRWIPAAHAHVAAGNWQRDKFRGHQLDGKILGIIGLGRTGTKVGHYAKAFQMEVKYYDPFVSVGTFEKINSLKELVATCDIVSLHVHLSDGTRGMMNQEIWKNAKAGSYFINTSRGQLVDEVAMVTALEAGRLAGIASDVLATEQVDFKNSPLYKSLQSGHNIILTPHLGGATWEAMTACEEFMVNRFLALRA